MSDFGGLRNEVLNDPTAKEASGLGLQDIRQVQPSFQPNAETSFIHLAEPGMLQFAILHSEDYFNLKFLLVHLRVSTFI